MPQRFFPLKKYKNAPKIIFCIFKGGVLYFLGGKMLGHFFIFRDDFNKIFIVGRKKLSSFLDLDSPFKL